MLIKRFYDRHAAGVLSLAIAICTLGQGSTASAQEATEAAKDAQLDEIIVTANRREESQKEVPVSVSVVKDEMLGALGTSGQDVRVLAFRVPSLNIESSNGRTFPRFYIRGYGNTDFGPFASQPVSLVLDDVVLESPALKGFPIFDQDSVEVLRGPQGTLFGRNTPAGVVKFNSAKPKLDRLEGYVAGSVGTYATLNIEGAINIPVSQSLALRISAQEQHRDDWVKNTFDNTRLEGYDDLAGRVQLLWRPSTSFEALLNVHGRSLEGSARLFRANIIAPGTNKLVAGFDPKVFPSDGKNMQSYRGWGTNLRLTWSGPAVTITSISALEKIERYRTQGDIDGGYGSAGTPPFGPGPIPFAINTGGGVNDHEQLTQELRIATDPNRPFSAQAGLYLFHEDVTANQGNFDRFGQTRIDIRQYRQVNNAEALFASVTWKPADALKLSGGLRYTWDRRRLDILQFDRVAPPIGPLLLIGPRFESASAHRLNYDLSAVYSISDNTNIYARVASGFRAPSFSAPAAGQSIQRADAEDVTSFEVGLKTEAFDRRVRLNADAYVFKVKNQQLSAVGGSGNQTRLLNANRSVGSGFEADFEAKITPELELGLSGAYNFTALRDPTISVATCRSCTVLDPRTAFGTAIVDGNPLPQAPRWTGTASLNYRRPVGDGGEIYAYGDVAYRSSVSFFLYQSIEFNGPPLTQVGLRAGYKWGDGKFDVAVFCRNCTNQVEAIGAIDFVNLTGMINDPRIIGLQFRAGF